MKENSCDWNFIKTVIKIFLTIIPVIIAAFSLFYTIRTATPLFITVIGASNSVIGGFLLVLSLFSASLAFVSLSSYKKGSSSFYLQAYVGTTFLSFIFCIAIIIYTSISSQGYIESSFKEFSALNTKNPNVVQFNKNYINDFDKTKFFFSVGETINEAFVILTVVWTVCIAAFFIITDVLDDSCEDLHED